MECASVRQRLSALYLDTCSNSSPMSPVWLCSVADVISPPQLFSHSMRRYSACHRDVRQPVVNMCSAAASYSMTVNHISFGKDGSCMRLLTLLLCLLLILTGCAAPGQATGEQ